MKSLGQILPTIAEMDTTIQLQSFTTAGDAYGGPTKTWTTYATERAKREYSATTSGENYDGQVNLSVLRIGFTIRWQPTVTVSVKHRILYDSEYYDIVKIEELGRRRYLKITADRKI